MESDSVGSQFHCESRLGVAGPHQLLFFRIEGDRCRKVYRVGGIHGEQRRFSQRLDDNPLSGHARSGQIQSVVLIARFPTAGERPGAIFIAVDHAATKQRLAEETERLPVQRVQQPYPHHRLQVFNRRPQIAQSYRFGKADHAGAHLLQQRLTVAGSRQQ